MNDTTLRDIKRNVDALMLDKHIRDEKRSMVLSPEEIIYQAECFVGTETYDAMIELIETDSVYLEDFAIIDVYKQALQHLEKKYQLIPSHDEGDMAFSRSCLAPVSRYINSHFGRKVFDFRITKYDQKLVDMHPGKFNLVEERLEDIKNGKTKVVTEDE